MAEYKQTITGTHKKGLFGGMFSAGMKMGFFGAAMGALLTVATGGLALPAVFAGFFVAGMAGSGYAVARWTKESAMNATLGRPRLNENKVEMRAGYERGEGLEQGKGPGTLEALGGLGVLGATLLSVRDIFKGKNKGKKDVFGDRGGKDIDYKKVIKKLPRDDKGNLELNAKDLARPEVREALKAYAKATKEGLDGADIDEQLAHSDRAAKSVDVSNLGKITVNADQLTNKDSLEELLDIGEGVQKSLGRLDRGVSSEQREYAGMVEKRMELIHKGKSEQAAGMEVAIAEAKAELDAAQQARESFLGELTADEAIEANKGRVEVVVDRVKQHLQESSQAPDGSGPSWTQPDEKPQAQETTAPEPVEAAPQPKREAASATEIADSVDERLRAAEGRFDEVLKGNSRGRGSEAAPASPPPPSGNAIAQDSVRHGKADSQSKQP